jgi:hypothetical protein
VSRVQVMPPSVVVITAPLKLADPMLAAIQYLLVGQDTVSRYSSYPVPNSVFPKGTLSVQVAPPSVVSITLPPTAVQSLELEHETAS